MSEVEMELHMLELSLSFQRCIQVNGSASTFDGMGMIVGAYYIHSSKEIPMVQCMAWQSLEIKDLRGNSFIAKWSYL